jgi:hypothetical protein
MKKCIAFIVSFMLLVLSAQAQNDCEKLLEDGLYQKINITARSSFSQDLRTYFLSETFKNDVRKGSWGGSFAIPIDGVPFNLGANSSDEDFSTFKRKIESSTQLNVATSDFINISKQLPNTSLYDAYVECKKIPDGNAVGFFAGKKIETEKTVIFTFYFRQADVNAKAPKVESFTVEPKSALLSDNGIKVGKRIPSYLMSVVCLRSEEHEVTCTIQTGSGHVTANSGPTQSSKTETPIGTVITSFLAFDRFREAIGESGTWKFSSKWAPCDGRDVTTSAFAKHSGASRVPDLRGMFLRGLNTFDYTPPATVNPINPSQRDPEDRVPGSFQGDDNKSHRHNTEVAADMVGTPDGGGDVGPGTEPHNSYWRGNRGVPVKAMPTTLSGNNESRPKNVAVYYYIKIN